MISFSLHIPSVIIGFLIGYILVSIVWIITSTDKNWHVGFGEGYKIGRKDVEDEYKEVKDGKNSVETEK